MDTYYVKEGNKYIPKGVYDMDNNLPDGIWFIRSNPGSKAYTSMASFVDYERNKFVHLNKIAEEIEASDVLVKIIHDKIKANEFVIYNQSMQDFAEQLVKALYSVTGVENRKKKKYAVQSTQVEYPVLKSPPPSPKFDTREDAESFKNTLKFNYPAYFFAVIEVD